MITFDKEGLHFDVDLIPEDFEALEKYVAAVRIDERIRLIQFLNSTLPKPEAAPETTEEAPADAPEEVADESTND